MNIGVEIKRLRIEHGWTQEELAAKLNRKKNSISQYENGTREPDLETIGKLADIFGVETGHFFNSPELKPTGYESKDEFVTALLTLLIKQGKIKDVNNISKETMDMIINAIKIEAQKILEAEK